MSSEKTKKVSVGTSNETEVSEKLGLTITAAASVEYGPVSGSLESSFEKELNVTRRSKTEIVKEEEVGKKYSPEQGERTVSYWMRTDEYTLYVPGDEANPILQYTWVDPSEWEDGWPKESRQ